MQIYTRTYTCLPYSYIYTYILVKVPDIITVFFSAGMENWGTSNTGCVKYQWTKVGWLTPLSQPQVLGRPVKKLSAVIHISDWRQKIKRNGWPEQSTADHQRHNETYINAELLQKLYIKVKYKTYRSKITSLT